MFIDGDSQNGDVQDDQNLETGQGDEGSAGDAKGKKDAGEAGDTGSKPTLESLQAELTRSQSERDAYAMRLLDPDYQEYVQTRRNGGTAKEKPEPKDPFAGLDDEKLGAMTNRQLIETAVSVFTTKLREEFLPEIESRLESVADTLEDQKARRDVSEAAGRHKDFWEFKPQMVQLSNQSRYANLGAEDLYVLAKGLSGKSAAAPAAKEKVEADPAKAASARATSEKPGAGASGRQAQSKEMTAEEAGDDAWEKAFGKKK